eukprot:Nitzschia sp. Nitz4//scaffold22_size323478//157981//160475//NITZ4_000539-RA/size323478-augustus-gene-0.200-mRNA-1//1//CDS//3329543031//5564//frame0
MSSEVDPSHNLLLPNDASSQLVSQILKLGFATSNFDDSTEDRPFLFPDPSGNVYYNVEGLGQQIIQLVNERGGRILVQEVCNELGLPATFCQTGTPLIKHCSKAFEVEGEYLCSRGFWEYLTKKLSKEVQEEGKVSLAQFSIDHKVAIATVLEKCVPSLPNAVVPQNSDSCVFHKSFLSKQKETVTETLRGLTEPRSILSLCQEHDWDFGLVLGWLETLEENQLLGTLHIDPSTKQTATFEPMQYKLLREKQLCDVLSNNGFLLHPHGFSSMGQALDVSRQTYPEAFLLGDMILLPFLLESIRNGMEDLTAKGYCHVSDYVSGELCTPLHLTRILGELSFDESVGVLVFAQDHALFVSHEKIKEIYDRSVAPLVVRHAREIAIQTHASKNAGADGTSDGAKRGKGKKTKPPKAVFSGEDPIVPLSDMVTAIVHGSPEMFPGILDHTSRNWAVLEWKDNSDSGLLPVEFCKHAILSDEFITSGINAVHAELRTIEQTKKSKVTVRSSSIQPISGNAEEMFEELFARSCYAIQLYAKFLRLASNSNDMMPEIVEELELFGIRTLCADLTRRMTQYCLYKHQVDETYQFSKGNEKHSKDRSSLPNFCHGDGLWVDGSSLRIPHLSCPSGKPMNDLKESLPIGVGHSLAQQWQICGTECYDDSEDEGCDIDASERFARFTQHINENSLNICGIPFKVLDKRAEKKFLSQRKDAIVGLLEGASDAETVLDLTVKILFQQVKQVVVFLPQHHLRGVALDLLRGERKILEPVGDVLKALANELTENTELVDQHLIDTVKECGLSKDISKHVVNKKE